MSEDRIVNKVAESGLLEIDLEKFYFIETIFKFPFVVYSAYKIETLFNIE